MTTPDGLTAAYTEQDVDDIEWVVWYARKRSGRARDVARAALDENPDIRLSARHVRDTGCSGLAGWYASVIETWREAWEGKDHRYGHDMAAFVGERLATDFSLRDIARAALAAPAASQEASDD